MQTSPTPVGLSPQGVIACNFEHCPLLCCSMTARPPCFGLSCTMAMPHPNEVKYEIVSRSGRASAMSDAHTHKLLAGASCCLRAEREKENLLRRAAPQRLSPYPVELHFFMLTYTSRWTDMSNCSLFHVQKKPCTGQVPGALQDESLTL